jgi:acetylornithine deacetylase/succinyl-diaminopimelate desuccinylase-like protein
MVDVKEIAAFIRQRAGSSEYRDYMVKLLCDLIDVDTTTTDRPLSEIASNEKKAFDILEKSLKTFAGEEITFERASIDPAIENHPYYTKTYYTANDEYPLGQPVEASYKDRFNLFAIVNPEQKSEKGKPVLLNAHMDTVSPFYPSRVDDKYVHGRGSCDDKDSIVLLVASMKILAEVKKKFGPIPMKPSVYQFVIEEEPGGNGSLSAAMDKRFQGYEAIIIEASQEKPYIANRGAMWFQLNLNGGAGVNFAEIIPFAIYELSRLGRQLRDETNLPLFPKDYVQVNLGALNSFGRHPSAVNDHVVYEFSVKHPKIDQESLTARLHDIITSALSEYAQAYFDRTREIDPETNQPKLARHYDLTAQSAGDGETTFKLEIFGVGGHMGAMLLRDNALIKTGFIMQAVIRDLRNQADVQTEFRLAESGFDPAKLIMAGGVGFTPAHKMADLKIRLMDAVKNGIKNYNETVHASVSGDVAKMTFDKLHNEAYESSLDCPAMKAFRQAYDTMNLAWPEPVAWRASCDSRIYGNNGYNTVTFGPGDLADAHSDHEKISFESLHRALELITLTTLALVAGQYE